MAKWTNKGHEFDELGNYFKEHPNIIIAGESGDELSAIKKKLNFLGDKAVTTEKINMLTFNLLNIKGEYNDIFKLRG